MVASSARVAEPWGFRVPALVPVSTPVFTAQVTASEAQLDTLAKSGYSCVAMPPWVVS